MLNGAVLCRAVLNCAVLCLAVLTCAVLCSAVLNCALLCRAVLSCAVLCRAVLHCAVLCSAVLSCAVLCLAVLNDAVLSRAVLNGAVLCRTVLNGAVLCCAGELRERPGKQGRDVACSWGRERVVPGLVLILWAQVCRTLWDTVCEAKKNASWATSTHVIVTRAFHVRFPRVRVLEPPR